MTNITVINGKNYQAETISGKGLCYVPVKTGMEVFTEYVSHLGIASRTSADINKLFEFFWCGTPCKFMNISLERSGALHAALLITSRQEDMVENVFCIGINPTWEEFIAKLKLENVTVTVK